MRQENPVNGFGNCMIELYLYWQTLTNLEQHVVLDAFLDADAG
jgi:hypothetical protein